MDHAAVDPNKENTRGLLAQVKSEVKITMLEQHESGQHKENYDITAVYSNTEITRGLLAQVKELLLLDSRKFLQSRV